MTFFLQQYVLPISSPMSSRPQLVYVASYGFFLKHWHFLSCRGTASFFRPGWLRSNQSCSWKTIRNKKMKGKKSNSDFLPIRGFWTSSSSSPFIFLTLSGLRSRRFPWGYSFVLSTRMATIQSILFLKSTIRYKKRKVIKAIPISYHLAHFEHLQWQRQNRFYKACLKKRNLEKLKETD